MKTSGALGGLVLIVVGVGTACGGSSGGSGGEADAAPGVDGSGQVVDGAPADGATIDAVRADAALTTTSTWNAAAGLPETTCVPWELHDTSDPEAPALDGGHVTVGNDTDGEVMYYAHPPAVLAFPTNLVIEGTVRFVAGSSPDPSRTGVDLGFTLADDRKNLLFIGDGEVFMLSAESTRGAAAAVATTDRAHTYRIEANTETGAIEVFQDGVSVLTTTTFVSPYDVEDGIQWGEATVVAHATSEWTSVTHNALAPVACP